jgi:hypothetical protein
MTVRYYKYNRNARAAARRVGLDPDVVVQPAPAGFYSVDFGDIEPTEPEPQGDGEPQETVAVEPQPEESTPEAEESAPVVESTELEEPNVDVALANAHLDGIPAFLQRAPESAEETAAREERLAHYAKDASPERELVVRKTSAAAPKEAKPTKIAAVIEKAKTVGITMAEVKAMTGWSKTGGFYGAIKRAGLTLTKDANGAYHAA